MAHEQILIVEDQRAVAGALKLRLRGLGYDVSAIARDGFEAIEKAAEFKPDLILMDIRLGDGMDGIETAHRIRSSHNIPVIYISAHVDHKLLERARATHPAGFINKPFTTKDLLTAIDFALHPHAAPASGVNPSTQENERTKDGVVTADSEGRIGFLNAAAESITGWYRRQTVGRPLAEMVSSIYGQSLSDATSLVRRVLNVGSEEMLARPTNGRVGQQSLNDTLTPLYDSRGQVYGIALQFAASAPTSAQTAAAGNDGALAKALDSVAHGVLVLNAELRIRHSNRAARDTLTRNRGVEIRNDILTVSDKQLDQRLRELVQSAITKGQQGRDDASGAMFVRSPLSREHIEIVVAPVPGSEREGSTGSVLIYLFDVNSPRQVSFDVLTGLYGLTHTEAKLVQLMTNGMTMDEAAEELQISVNTARTHLKHIFHKTGINRQTELIHRIESGPASLVVGFDQTERAEPTSRR